MLPWFYELREAAIAQKLAFEAPEPAFLRAGLACCDDNPKVARLALTS
jgi:hypothetical protein